MKFSCVDSNEAEIGIIEAPDADQALKMAQKLNKNVREVRSKSEPQPAVAEKRGRGKKEEKAE